MYSYARFCGVNEQLNIGFAGFVLGNMRQDDLHVISRDIVVSALALLLQDAEVNVRVRTAEALSLLHHV